MLARDSVDVVGLGVGERTLDLKGGQRQVDATDHPPAAQLPHAAAVGRENTPGVAAAGRGAVALLQAVGVGEVERQVIERLVDQTAGSADARVFGGAMNACQRVVIGCQAALAAAEHQAPLRGEGEGIADDERTLFGVGRVIPVGEIGVVRLGEIDRIAQAGGAQRLGAAGCGVVVVPVETGEAEGQVMAYRPGVDGTVEVGEVAVDGETAGRRARHRRTVGAGVVDQGVGHAGGFPVGDLPQGADVELPVAVEIMFEVRAGGVGGVVVARVVLAQMAFAWIRRVGQGDAGGDRELARQPFGQVVVVAEVGLDDAVVADLEVCRQAHQLTAQRTARRVAVPLFVDQIETVFDLAFSIEWATEVGGLEPAQASADAQGHAVAGEVSRPLGQQVEGACGVGRAVERSRQPAEHFNALQLLGRVIGCRDHIEPVQTTVLHHAALQTTGLRSGTVGLHRGEVTDDVLEALELLAVDQIAGHDADGVGRVLQAPLAHRPEGRALFPCLLGDGFIGLDIDRRQRDVLGVGQVDRAAQQQRRKSKAGRAGLSH